MENLRGIGWMTAAMVLFTLADSFIKAASTVVPVGQVLLVLGMGGAAIFAGFAVAREVPVFSTVLFHPIMVLRNVAEMGATVCVIYSLALTPLSSVSAIMQATPLAVTLGAALFMGAQVGWRRWLAILMGLAGVLIIIRPGMDGFLPASLLTVAGVLGLAIRDLTSRTMPPHIHVLQMSTYGFSAVALCGAVLLFVGAPAVIPDPTTALFLLGAVLFGSLGYFFIVSAMRTGDIAAVTPFRYTRLIFALIIAVLFFGERPDAWTLIGAAIVIGTGLYTLIRETRVAQA